MKIFMIAALSLDGYIAQNKSQSSLQWTSQADKKRFVELTKRAGVVVMGSTTYKTIGRPLKDRRNIVYTSSPEFFEGGIEATSLPPADLIKKLEQQGHTEVAICGGAQIYTLFAKAGLIDTMYLTIEPVILGSGIRLFNEDMFLKLELTESTITENTLLLTYNVIQHVNHH